MNNEVGELNLKVIELLELEHDKPIPIFLGKSNIEHMKRQHPNDYQKYGKYIKEIIKYPTYVAKNPNQGSIEYIKEYNNGNENVLVAIRTSRSNKMYARTLFVMTEKKMDTYIKKGYAKKYQF